MDDTDAQMIRAAANPPAPTVGSAEQATQQTYEPADIFAWANNLYQYKDQLQLDLFLINKNNVVYSAQLSKELEKQLQPLFLDNILEYVLEGAAEGLVVRDFEEAEAEDNVLQRTPWGRVDTLLEVMHWLRTQEQEIVQFVEQEHDLKRLKGAMLRGRHPAMAEPFYIIKALPKSQMMKGEGAWMISGKIFMPFEDAVALKIPSDNHLVIVGQDLFVFNQSKLRSLFGYDAKKNSIAIQKVKAIQDKFQLSFEAGDDMQSLVKGNRILINKLQRLELREGLTQNQLLDHGEELGIELMVDESGAIIIENSKELSKFINLLNDDYVESNLTGIRYEIQRKRELKPPKEDNV